MDNRILNASNLAIFLLVLGAALLGYSLTLSPYVDEKLFMERYMSLSSGQSTEYWKLRDEMLTSKYQLEDYGISLLSLAIAVFFVTRKGRVRLQAPRSRTALIALAFALPFLSVGGYVFDLSLAYMRGEFPHWGDSMGMPLYSVPTQFFILLVWSVAHLAFLRGSYHPSARLNQALSLKSNWWLLFVAVATAFYALMQAVAGLFWYAIPLTLWLYFYLSIAACHREKKSSLTNLREVAKNPSL